jgi:translation initiation factor IF-2
MSKVTVKQLAEVVGTPVERLLEQMKEAGIEVSGVDQAISDDEKMKLLDFLRQSHGKSNTDAGESERKITLRRKSLSELKVRGAGRSKTVNVEVRRKRTYVKRTAPKPEKIAEEPEEVLEETAKAETPEALEPIETPQAVESVEEPEVVEPPEIEKAVEQPEVAEVVEPEPPKVVEAPKAVEAPEEPKAVETPEPIKEKPAASKAPMSKSAQLAKQLEAETKALRQANIDSEEEKRKVAESIRVKVEEKARLAEEKAKLEREKAEASSAADKTPAADKPKTKARRKKTTSSEPTRYGRRELHAPGGTGRRKKKPAKRRPVVDAPTRHGFEKPTAPVVRELELGESISVVDMAQQLAVKSSEVIKTLMGMGVMATINQVLDQDTATLVAEEMGHGVKLKEGGGVEAELTKMVTDSDDREQLARAPVVTIMGHVDHGKTSLLDHIRSSRVAAGEAGGITQHIGAYSVDTDHGKIAFLDTPGHAAFTSMRARGAQVTDIVILVVAADDGVMPQTEEAVQHAKAAGVPLVVAVNKIDKENADPERVRSELSKFEVIPEDWGGENMFVNVSAQTGEGIDALLDAVLLQSEVLELKAPVTGNASGAVIESSLDKGRGPVATILVQKGTLKRGDIILSGQEYGRVRAMFDETGKQVKTAGPSSPVEVLGLSGAPDAGDDVIVVESERKAREVAKVREDKIRENKLVSQQAARMENLFKQMQEGEVGIVNVFIKADVQGSAEALRDSLNKLSTDEVKVNIVAANVGGISESDVNLAMASQAIMVGFNVRADAAARRAVEENEVDLRYYSVIYELIDDVKKALSGLLPPELREEIVGIAEVRDVFKSSAFGAVAGCLVVDGVVKRGNPIRVLRDNVVIYEGELESLRRFKDMVNEVQSGTECGIAVKNYNDVKPGDQIENFVRTEIQREL